MADELNPTASSQPASAAGPNGSGKPAEASSPGGMTPSQQSDYYNKTQQLAAERRALEEERRAFEAERQAYPQRYGQNSTPQNQYGPPQGFVPGQAPGGFVGGPQVPGMQPAQGFMPPPNYGKLVEQFGQEGANEIMAAFNALAGPVQQEFQQAQALLNQTQAMTLFNHLAAKGKETFGDEWKDHGKETMELVTKYGMPLEKAWYAVTGEKAFQRGKDAAYQAQQTKEAAQVAQPGGPAPQQGQTPIKSFSDAYNAALQEHTA